MVLSFWNFRSRRFRENAWSVVWRSLSWGSLQLLWSTLVCAFAYQQASQGKIWIMQSEWSRKSPVFSASSTAGTLSGTKKFRRVACIRSSFRLAGQLLRVEWTCAITIQIGRIHSHFCLQRTGKNKNISYAFNLFSSFHATLRSVLGTEIGRLCLLFTCIHD